MSTPMRSAIPSTIFNQITQTRSSPKTIAALLNEAENTYSDEPLHFNAKRRYPFWKPCEACGEPFMCRNRAQAQRNRFCKACVTARLHEKRGAQEWRRNRVELTCPVCGKRFWRHKANVGKAKLPTCSRQCNGVLRGQEWAQHAYKGRAAWKPESEAALVERMTGETNPAWKGGVTFWRKKGNYPPIKYVRCPKEYLPMARKDGYVMEHRLLVAQSLGRCLRRGEVVHHVNHDATDNRLENLMLFASNTAHKSYEAHGRPAPLWQP